MVEPAPERDDAPTYEGLYRLWEEEAWSATAIDFSVDVSHWRERLTERQKEAALWNHAMFLTGVHTEARTIASAALSPRPRLQSVLLAAQGADEARHRIFLERFGSEVVGIDPADALEAAEARLTWGFKRLFGELENVGEALRKNPSSLETLAQLVALCHIVIEGVLAIPGHHFLLRYVERTQILPALATGLAHTARDEQRHTAFGMRLLGELIASSRDCRAAAVEMWDRALPWTIGVFVPPDRDPSYVECFDFTLNDVYSYGLRALESRLSKLGIDPGELWLIARDDRSLPYEERAHRLWVLIDSGVLGDETREPEPTREALEILFESMTRAVDEEVARSLGGPIQWDFTDGEPWHLIVVDGHVEAKPGSAGEPALRLEMSAAEFAKIAAGRGDARWALLRRRLRIHGSLAAKAKLPKLFD